MGLIIDDVSSITDINSGHATGATTYQNRSGRDIRARRFLRFLGIGKTNSTFNLRNAVSTGGENEHGTNEVFLRWPVTSGGDADGNAYTFVGNELYVPNGRDIITKFVSDSALDFSVTIRAITVDLDWRRESGSGIYIGKAPPLIGISTGVVDMTDATGASRIPDWENTTGGPVMVNVRFNNDDSAASDATFYYQLTVVDATIKQLSFNNGAHEPVAGETITDVDSGKTATVVHYVLDSGAWDGSGAGMLFVTDPTGAFTPTSDIEDPDTNKVADVVANWESAEWTGYEGAAAKSTYGLPPESNGWVSYQPVLVLAGESLRFRVINDLLGEVAITLTARMLDLNVNSVADIGNKPSIYITGA